MKHHYFLLGDLSTRNCPEDFINLFHRCTGNFLTFAPRGQHTATLHVWNDKDNTDQLASLIEDDMGGVNLPVFILWDNRSGFASENNFVLQEYSPFQDSVRQLVCEYIPDTWRTPKEAQS